MRYVITLFWGIILVQMINYILGSMTNVTNLTFDKALIVGIIFSIVVMILAAFFKDDQPQHVNEQHS